LTAAVFQRGNRMRVMRRHHSMRSDMCRGFTRASWGSLLLQSYRPRSGQHTACSRDA
jgi:hypothetical protein